MPGLKTGFVDFHAHVLPGADHGSDSVRTSLAQLELLRGAGVEAVVATPHFYPQNEMVEGFIVRRESSVNVLWEAMRDRNDLPKIAIGAEVLLCPEMDKMPGLSQLCIRGTDTILVEMPSGKWNNCLFDAIDGMRRMGLLPVIAHPGRYSAENTAALLECCNVSLQLNASESVSFFGRKRAGAWLSSGLVAAVGSDIHGADKKRAAAYSSFFKKFSDYGITVTERSRELLCKAAFLDKALIETV